MADVTITNAHISQFNSENVVLRINGVQAVVGSEINGLDLLEFESLSGATFDFVSLGLRDPNTGGFSEVVFDIDTPPTTASKQFPMFNKGSATFTLILSEIEGYTIEQSLINSLLDSNAEIYVNDVLATQGDLIIVGDVVSLKVVGDYVFTTAQLFVRDLNSGAFDYYQFTINETADLATIEWKSNFSGDDYSTGFQVETIPHAPDVSGSNRVYLVSSEVLDSVNDERFKMVGDNVIDYGNYILGLIELPTSIPEEFLLPETNIQLGDLTLSASAATISTDNLSIDLGEIHVPVKNNNLLDYKGVICNLHLPRTNSIVINPDYVIGETISIEYIIDLYSGEATINVSSSKVGGEVFHTVTTTLGVEIPYIRTGSSANVSNPNIAVGGDNRINTPFIEVLTNDVNLPDGVFTIPIVDENTLFDESGYIEVENIELKGWVKLSDRQKIINLLNSGVIIK